METAPPDPGRSRVGTHRAEVQPLGRPGRLVMILASILLFTVGANMFTP
ncbi:hypothetical protein ACFQX7_01490 [Luedemannella flava]